MQGLAQCARQIVFVQPPRELGAAQLNQEIHKAGVTEFVELEQRPVHRLPVRTNRIEYLSRAADAFTQPVFSKDVVAFAGQFQFQANPLRGHEEPLPDPGLTFDGAQAAAQGHIVIFAFAAPAELDPRITCPIRVPAHQEVPFHSFGGIRIRLQALRDHFAIQQKRKLQRQHTGFAGPIVSAQQQSAVFVVKFLLIVLVDIDEAAAQRLPALPLGNGKQVGPHAVSGRSVSVHKFFCETGSSAYRPIAAIGTTPSAVVRTNRSATRRSSVSSASRVSAPGARASLRHRSP